MKNKQLIFDRLVYDVQHKLRLIDKHSLNYHSMRFFSIFFLSFFLFNLNLSSQNSAKELPKAFVIGENEQEYEKLFSSHSQTLLSTCDNDMQIALEKWFTFIQEIENYADKIKFDINGVKTWIHVFWDEEGNLEHIGFFLQPESRNISTKDLTAFFTSFVGKSKMNIESNRKFAHYTSAAFPTFNGRLVKD